MQSKITRGNILKFIRLKCKVAPLGRPRLSLYTGCVYQPKKNQEPLLNALTTKNSNPPIDSECIVDADIYFRKPKTSKLAYPTGRNHGDEDNLRKGINDALVSKGILVDDSIVLGGETFKQFGSEDEVFIYIYEVA